MNIFSTELQEKNLIENKEAIIAVNFSVIPTFYSVFLNYYDERNVEKKMTSTSLRLD